MYLQQAVAFAEIVASLGVILSLVYLARQLTQNTAMMQVAAASERVERDYQIVVPLLHSQEFADLWRRGDADFASLTETEKIQLLFFERQAIVLWHHLFGLRQRGLLPSGDWHEHVWIIRNLGRRQALRAAWHAFSQAYEKPFQDFVNQQFAEADAESQPASAEG